MEEETNVFYSKGSKNLNKKYTLKKLKNSIWEEFQISNGI